MSARSDKDAYSRQNGDTDTLFDPAGYFRQEHPASMEDETPDGDVESSASVPRWLLQIKSRWRDVLAWSFAALLLVRIAVAFYFAEFWIGYLPQFGLLALLTAELFFSKDRCISLVSCILLVDSLIADGYHLFTYRAVYHHRLELNWPYDDRIQIALVTLGLVLIVWKDRSVPRLAAAIPLLGIFLVLLVIIIASL